MEKIFAPVSGEAPRFQYLRRSDLPSQSTPILAQSHTEKQPSQGKTQSPDWIDQTLDRPWNSEDSLKVDRWLWYCELEGVAA